MASSQAAFLVMEQQVEARQSGIPVEQALLKAKGEGGGEGGLILFRAFSVVHGSSFPYWSWSSTLQNDSSTG